LLPAFHLLHLFHFILRFFFFPSYNVIAYKERFCLLPLDVVLTSSKLFSGVVENVFAFVGRGTDGQTSQCMYRER